MVVGGTTNKGWLIINFFVYCPMNFFLIGTTLMSVLEIGIYILKLLLYILVIAGIFWFIKTGGFNLKKRYLLKNGVSVEANVDGIERTIFDVGNEPVMKILLSYEDVYKSAHTVTIKHTFSSRSIIPNEGDKIRILIDSNNPERVMIAPENA